METLRAWYEDLIPENAVHWEPVQFGSHGGSGRSTRLIDQVTCPVCQLILQTKIADQQKAERQTVFDRRLAATYGTIEPSHAEQARRDQAEIRRAIQQAKEDTRRQLKREERDTRWAERRTEERLRTANRRGYADSESIKSRDRATHLSPVLEALDGWPEVHLDQAWEAIDELLEDQRQDPEHWIDLRRYHHRGELRW